MAVIVTMSRGEKKSTLINALIGKDILSSENAVYTALDYLILDKEY